MSTTRTSLREIILVAAQKGAPLKTVSALAKEARISRSSIYKYYPEIVLMLRGAADPLVAHNDNSAFQKLELLRKQLAKNKQVISYLTNICSNQLVEISELTEKLEQVTASSSAKIDYLKSKLAKLEARSLRAIK